MGRLPPKLLKYTLILATSVLLLVCGGGDDSDTDTAKTGDSDGGTSDVNSNYIFALTGQRDKTPAQYQEGLRQLVGKAQVFNTH